jgi:hypothetical protein
MNVSDVTLNHATAAVVLPAPATFFLPNCRETIVLTAVEKAAGGFLTDAHKRDLWPVGFGNPQLVKSPTDEPARSDAPRRISVGLVFDQFLRLMLAPLLEEEGYAGRLTLIADRAEPIWMRWRGLVARHSARDHLEAGAELQQVIRQDKRADRGLVGDEGLLRPQQGSLSGATRSTGRAPRVVPAKAMGRMLSLDEAGKIIRRIERGIPKRPAAHSVKRRAAGLATFRRKIHVFRKEGVGRSV